MALQKPTPQAFAAPPSSEPAPSPSPSPAPSPAPAPSDAPIAKPTPLPAPPAEDLAAYVDARRRARGETSAPSASSSVESPGESESERRNRIVAANLGLNRTPTFGANAKNAGGIFEITEVHYDEAAFYFFGFDKDIGRNAKQLIEVRKGDYADIQVAVVRKMISIIRENVSGDFLWASQRTGRRVSLSARPGDDAGLEEFIMRDVFPDARR